MGAVVARVGVGVSLDTEEGTVQDGEGESGVEERVEEEGAGIESTLESVLGGG